MEEITMNRINVLGCTAVAIAAVSGVGCGMLAGDIAEEYVDKHKGPNWKKALIIAASVAVASAAAQATVGAMMASSLFINGMINAK